MKRIKPIIFTLLLAVFLHAGIETGFAQTVSNPVYNHYTRSTSWSYVYFGMYPQSEVTEGDYLTNDVKNASYNINGDAIVDGHKFRRVLCKDEYNNQTWRYYIYEPILWKVLQVENGQLRQELFNLNTNISLVRMNLHEADKNLIKCYPSINEYTPTCPHGFVDCVYDPAYLKEYCTEWWVELGMPTSCKNCENGEKYDDEDK